jgi:hypothetical protein
MMAKIASNTAKADQNTFFLDKSDSCFGISSAREHSTPIRNDNVLRVDQCGFSAPV